MMETQIASNATQTSKFSTQLAIASFGIGTLILLYHLVNPNEERIIILGFIYVLFASLINGVVFLNLLYHFTTNPFQREILAIKMLLLLSNIPIAFIYILIVIQKF